TDTLAQCDDARQVGTISTRPAAAGVDPVRVPAATAQVAPREAVRAMGIPARARDARREDCEQLARRIAWIDDALRQPHDASTGDRLNAERRELLARQFSGRC
ncbi:MAG: hypothetical protein REI09_11410, partial [Candidatus Dactylopiibacterium sp.]|nr:hypothetical protein [Candidatus Dactylopiibacterium sp.]